MMSGRARTSFVIIDDAEDELAEEATHLFDLIGIPVFLPDNSQLHRWDVSLCAQFP